LSKIIIVAKVTIKEEFTSEIFPLLVDLHKSTHENDKGCIQYDLHKNLEDKNSFTFIETWENMEVLDAHMRTEHFLSFVKSVENKLVSLDISKLVKV
jgi:quinol monooxygenase YgiN